MPPKRYDSFKPGDLVFAKMKGFPHWPARVCKTLDGYKKRVQVYFFGTHQIGQVPPGNIVPYVGNKLKYGSGVRIKGFTEGMWEIQNTPGVGSKVKGAAKTNTQATPLLTSADKTTNDQIKSAPTKPGPGKTSKVPTEAAAKTSSRASLRFASEPASKQTTEKSLTSEDASTTETSENAAKVKRKRGRPRKNPLAPVGRSAGQTAMNISSTKEETEIPKDVAKTKTASTAVSETALHAETRTPAAKTTTASDVPAEKETLGSLKATAKAEISAEPEDAAAKLAKSKVDAEPPKRKRGRPAGRKRKLAEARFAQGKTSQNDRGHKKKKDKEEKEGNKLSENQEGKREEKNHEEVQTSAKEKPTEEDETKPLESRGRKRKKEEREKVEVGKQNKTKIDEGLGRKKDITDEGKGERSAESLMMKTRRAEKEQQKEKKKAKQDGNEQKEKTRRGRKRRRDKEVAVGNRVLTARQDESQGTKRRPEEKEEKEAQKKSKRDDGVEGKKEETETEKTGERSESEGGKLRRKDTGEDARKKKQTTEGKERAGSSVDKEGQHRLAANRDSVLKSLRGLLKAGRGAKRRDMHKAAQRAGDGPRKNTEIKKTPDIKGVRDSTVSKVIGKKPGVRALVKNKVAVKDKAEREDKTKRREERESTKKEEGETASGQKTTAEKKKDEPKTRTEQKAELRDKPTSKSAEEAKAKDKDSRQQNEDKTKADETKPQRDEEKKDERKIIGKIVKATAKQGTKVQVKTMMGGTMVPAKEEKTDSLKKAEEKRPGEVERKAERTRAATEEEKDKKSTAKSQEKKKEVDTAEQKKKPAKDSTPEDQSKAQKKSDKAERGEKSAEAKTSQEQMGGAKQEQPEAKRRSSAMTLTDSTLHRIHGDIRISLKSDNPDISKCLKALDQLSMVYVTSQHVQRHSELVATLRKMRFYRANQAIMDKASMLYNRFKNAFLVGEGEEVVSATFLHSLLEEKEREEERCREKLRREDALPEGGVREGQEEEEKTQAPGV